MSNGADFFNDLMSQYTKKNDRFGYHCTVCGYEMDMIVAQAPGGYKSRKLFFCKKKDCVRFGDVRVVAKKKAKK